MGLITTDFQNRLKIHADDGFMFVFFTVVFVLVF